MAWRFPRHRFYGGRVVDPDAFNEAVYPFVSEAGRLNEHNWNASMATDLDPLADLAEDVAWTLASVAEECDVGVATYMNAYDLAPSGAWFPVNDTTVTLYSDGGPVYALFTGQWVLTDVDPANYPYAQFAIEVDGNIIAESVAGVLDETSGGEGAEYGFMGDCMGFDVEALVPLTPGLHVIRGVARMDVLRSSRLTQGDDIQLSSIIGHRELIVWEIAR